MGPMYSITAQGGFGLYRVGVSKKAGFPYPIGIRPKIYLGMYYHPYGWYYQRRRTWHGIIWAAHKYPGPPPNPQTPLQQGYRGIFADGVSTWQGMDSDTKDYYNKLKYPRKMTGFNRFLHYYLREHLWEGYPVGYYLLLETGDKILQEDGYGILLE